MHVDNIKQLLTDVIKGNKLIKREENIKKVLNEDPDLGSHEISSKKKT